MEKYWNLRNINARQALLNMVLGARSIGKTFGSKSYGVKNFLDTGECFIWLRRYNSELIGATGAINTFFDDIKRVGKMSDVKMHVETKNKMGIIYVNDKVAGFILSLSMFQKYKGADFSKVGIIFFDEFLIKDGVYPSYIGGMEEPTLLLDVWTTVYRDRKPNGKIVMLANYTDIHNPYFRYFKIKPFDRGSQLQHGILVEIYKNDKQVEAVKQTPFGKLIDGTKYGQYALENQPYNNNPKFIYDTLPATAKYRCTVKYAGLDYGVYVDFVSALYFINTNVDYTHTRIYSMTTADHDINYVLVDTLKQTALYPISLAFKRGQVRFSDIMTKECMLEAFGYLRK